MKKVLLSLGLIAITGSFAMAQDSHSAAVLQPSTAPKEASNTASSLKPENMEFKTDMHDFGTVAEGPDAEFKFEFKNTGKEPIILSAVTASCGCTAPEWSKEPVLPGKKSVIKAVYHSAGRPGGFNKTITVTSNAGVKVLTIKGTVEKAPESSVPANKSMMKTQ
eukprot:TRINITY_DN81218_c0_g1_i1.p1 TRINITY_DN81218_c0_g1~~TRINITY_DN81218_c0_g1_i1.p1  ORF type:complete len:164 (+),score=21.61 TRINITY_DN81218_c0_g1_i1:101-592(+)